MKNSRIFVICSFLCFLYPVNIFADEEYNKNQTTTQLQLKLNRKISPGVLPGEDLSENELFASTEKNLEEMNAKNRLENITSTYILDSSGNTLPKTGVIRDSWLYSGLGMLISALYLFITAKRKNQNKKGGEE
ncbi:LPXTG cell wall anchor domain-containing protein [Enterococcus faecalis]|uniref:LPXTG cell wall anchor domain-containing protein n=1 Tax=Enterococcus faecalis TaxID=1351 RepID=UPI001F5778D7|nr:LPXTG cell wall anchor domain-containing protein [Enterococcus faecalis]